MSAAKSAALSKAPMPAGRRPAIMEKREGAQSGLAQ